MFFESLNTVVFFYIFGKHLIENYLNFFSNSHQNQFYIYLYFKRHFFLIGMPLYQLVFPVAPVFKSYIDSRVKSTWVSESIRKAFKELVSNSHITRSWWLLFVGSVFVFAIYLNSFFNSKIYIHWSRYIELVS